MIVSWGVFEHITNPEFYAGELGRLLRPGGWLCAWTPNKWCYAAIGARIALNRAHARVLKRLGTRRREEDIFPTVYRMNTRLDLKRLFPSDRFAHCTYVHSGPPVYHGGNVMLARLVLLYEWLAPEGLGRSLYVFIQKKAAVEDQHARQP